MHRLVTHLVIYLVTLVATAAVVGCGDSGAGPDPDPTADAAVTTPDGGTVGDYTTLISREWSVPPGDESYYCTRVTLTEDAYISGFRALAPLGTHHTVLSVHDAPIAADGDYDCFAVNIAHTMLFASGVGTDDLVFPEGVAIKVQAGQQLDLNLHVFNLRDTALTGTSGTQVVAVPAGEVVQEAEVVFGGADFFSIEDSPGVEQTIGGGCLFNRDATVIALWPHMHQIGRRMRVTHQGETVLDEPFVFEEQKNYYLGEPLAVAAGQRFDIDCVYVNGTGGTVTWGDSSNQEMCYLGIYRFPATGASTFSCVE